MNALTEELLTACMKAGYTRVEIYPEEVKTDWPGRNKGREEPHSDKARTALWGIVDNLKISCGCGNPGHHNIKRHSLTLGLWTRSPRSKEWREAAPEEVIEMLKAEQEKWVKWAKDMWG